MALGTPTLRAEQTAVGTGLSADVVATVGATGVASGSLILVAFACGAATAPTVTIADSKGNTYTLDKQANNNTNTHAYSFSAPATSALVTGDTITAHITAVTYSHADLQVIELTGADVTGSRVNGTPAGATGTSTSGASGNTTTSVANTCLFSLQSEGNVFGFTPSGSFTTIKFTSVGATKSLETMYRNVTATGTYNPQGTWASSVAWAATAVAYKEATAGASATNPPGFRFGFR